MSASVQDSRILVKRSTVPGVVPTIPATNDHTDGTWLATDIYKGELFINLADGLIFTRTDAGIAGIGSSFGALSGSPADSVALIAYLDANYLHS